jgi:hypothetical protein
MITETSITQFTDKVHENGAGLEKRVANHLEANYIPYKSGKNNGIDFIIEGKIHMDCCAQGISGSIVEKIPHKVWKYVKKYGIKDIYLLHPYSPITETVGGHLSDLEKWLECNIHILDWNDFTYLVGGGSFEKRKPYNFVKNSAKIRNARTSPAKLKEFFQYN